jgi:peptide deformylase
MSIPCASERARRLRAGARTPSGTLVGVSTFPVRVFGDPVLRQRAREVEELDGDLARLVDAMFDTMHDAQGLGLAAPQVGVLKRLYTYDLGDGPSVIVNPEIVESSGEWVYEEGCLSVPGLHFEIVRPRLVTVRGVDLDGKEVVFEGDELMGRLIQHEVDHLDGTLLLDRLDPDRRKEAMRELRQAQLDGTVAAAVGGSDVTRRL